MEEFKFFLEVLVAGLLSGVMYSLVALGFVLIYKTSGVFNFAQGAQLLFAALTFVSLNERGIPMWGAFAISLAIMVLVGILIERVVLRPLVAQTQMTLFMATIGLAYIIEGAAQLAWGTEVHSLDLGIDDIPMDCGACLSADSISSPQPSPPPWSASSRLSFVTPEWDWHSGPWRRISSRR